MDRLRLQTERHERRHDQEEQENHRASDGFTPRQRHTSGRGLARRSYGTGVTGQSRHQAFRYRLGARSAGARRAATLRSSRTIPGSRRPLAAATASPASCQGSTFRSANADMTLRAIIARWRNLCHQLMGISSVSRGNVLLAPIIGWILCALKYLLGRCRLAKSHRSPPPSSCFGAAQLASRQLFEPCGLSIFRQPRLLASGGVGRS